MARDPLGALHDDILRLLPSGGALAPSDESLRASAEAVALLAEKVPALRPLSALVVEVWPSMFDVSPDGRRFVMVQTTGSPANRMLIVQGFFSELQKKR